MPAYDGTTPWPGGGKGIDVERGEPALSAPLMSSAAVVSSVKSELRAY